MMLQSYTVILHNKLYNAQLETIQFHIICRTSNHVATCGQIGIIKKSKLLDSIYV